MKMLNLTVNNKNTKIMASVVSLSFLFIHIVMYFMFSACGVTPMAKFNIFSILFYLFLPVVIMKEKWGFYVIAVYLEVLVHMCLAVFFTGWNSGFQITLIGMTILAFYSEYMGRSMHINFISGTYLGILTLCCYIYSYILSVYYPAAYALPQSVSFWLQIIWAIVVFGIDIFYLKIFVLITSGSEEELSSQVIHDRLTGLANRYFMNDYLATLIKSGEAKEYWTAMADIDDFKMINDSRGHNCGDAVLKTLAELFVQNAIDIVVCRWGGEEFLFCGKLTGDSAEITAKLEKIRTVVEEHEFIYKEQPLHVTITIGAKDYEEGMSAEEWVNGADKNLYKGKFSGKNKVVYNGAE